MYISMMNPCTVKYVRISFKTNQYLLLIGDEWYRKHLMKWRKALCLWWRNKTQQRSDVIIAWCNASNAIQSSAVSDSEEATFAVVAYQFYLTS